VSEGETKYMGDESREAHRELNINGKVVTGASFSGRTNYRHEVEAAVERQMCSINSAEFAPWV
jgi:hypothetical protein